MSIKRESNGMSVLVVVTSPFINIVFNKEDEFSATLDDINNNTYDRLKICRTTMSIDGYISELTQKNCGVIVGLAGTLIYPRFEFINKDIVIKSANKVLINLMFGGITMNSVHPDDVGAGVLYKTGYYMLAGGASGKNYSFINALQFRSASSFDTIKLLDPKNYTIDEFRSALAKGSPIVEKIPQINPSIFLDGITYYKSYQLASALVFLWTTAEAIIGKIWTDKVVPKGKGIYKRKDFVKSNVWQSSFKTELLFQIETISASLYEKINEAREARNYLSHQGKTPTLKQCEAALEAIFSMISLVESDFDSENVFDKLVEGFKNHHVPFTGPLNPTVWREIPALPGDDRWGDLPYPRHSEIELVPLKPVGKDTNSGDSE